MDQTIRLTAEEEEMIIDCIADLHGFYPALEGGDLLIVAGDLTKRDTLDGYIDFKNWVIEAGNIYKKIIIIAGNHDNMIHNKPNGFDLYFCLNPLDKWVYLQDQGCEFEGLKIWGSPWTKTFKLMDPHCKAFTVDTEEELENKWQLVPPDTDILITHSPPFGILDGVENEYGGPLFHAGSSSLGYFVKKHKPKLHVFGHIHEGYGRHFHLNESYDPNDTIYVNASYVNELYEPVNKPVRIILDCIADLHGFYPELEGGDLWIIAGDSTSLGEKCEMRAKFIQDSLLKAQRRLNLQKSKKRFMDLLDLVQN